MYFDGSISRIQKEEQMWIDLIEQKVSLSSDIADRSSGWVGVDLIEKH